MSYSRNIPDWQQYNALQSGGSDAAKSGQNISSSHLYVPNISPPSMNGLNLNSDCLSKSQNDVINYSQRNYQPPNNTPSGPNSLVEPPLTSLVHMSSCVSHYGASTSMNSMIDDSSNVDLRNGSVAGLNEEMAHRNQISLNGPVPRVVGPNMNVANNLATAGTRIPPANAVPSSRQGPYMPACKGPCCVSDPNVNYQSWEKFPSYQSTNPYRENIRASGYANEPRRYRNDMAYRKDNYTSKDLIPPNSYHVDQRRNFTDYKYCKDPPVPRNYQPSTVLPNYPIQNYTVPGDYQKYAYTMKDYPRQGAVNSQNPGILKYSEHNVAMQEKYSPKQGQYQSGALLQKGLCVPSISSSLPSVQNPYLNPQFSRDYQWENHEKDSSKIQNPVPVHGTYPKYQMYQQKYAMQRYSMENHLRELSRIPGYQSHPKYQECILRYRELLRLQQTVDYQSAIQNTLTSANSTVPPINLQFDQNGVLINSNYLGNFPTPHNPTASAPINPEKEHTPAEDLQQLQNVPPRSESGPNPENIPRDVQFLNQKIENPHCQVPQREEENFETLRKEGKNTKNVTNKPDLDVRQFLANWVEVEEEEGANANLPDVVLSNSTPIVLVEYGNVGLVAHGPENAAEPKADNAPTPKSQEYFPKESTANLLQDCSNDLNQGIIYANKLNIKCVREGIDGVPTIHIVENPEEGFIYPEKAEMEVPGGSLPLLTETKESQVSETKETSMNLNYKKLNPKNSESKLQMNPEDLSILPLAKNNAETGASNLKKQNSFTNEENQNSDDISLPDLTTSECTPISTTLNTPTHSDSEECSDQGVDLTTSTNPIELIQNSPMISFTQSPVKIDPYEHLKGEHDSMKTSQDGLDFDFQENAESVIKEHNKDESKKAKNDGTTSKPSNATKYCQEKSTTPENSVNKDANEFSSNMDVFSTEDQDKWCWNSISLMPGDDELKTSTQVESGMMKIESHDEKINKVDDMWLDVDYSIPKGIDLSSEIKSSNSEKFNTDSERKSHKKTDIAQVSASVTKILKNIKERQHFIQNSNQEPNVKRNPKGISIISEEIFNSTWKQNTQNKIYPPMRKMSDSFERQEMEDFAENFKCAGRSRSKSLETNLLRSRSKSVESSVIDDQVENRLLTEFKNLKRKPSTDHCQEETKIQKLEQEDAAKQAVEVLKTASDEKKLNPNEGKGSDLEIKFRNSCDSSKPFEAIKIEINVSRSDGKSEKQISSQPQKCNEPDYNGNQEEPSSCGSTICSGKNSNCQSSKVETKIPNQKSDLEKLNFEETGEKSKIQGHERKESVIEYFGKSHHQKSQHACDTCKSMNFHKVDKDYLCNHLDNRLSKSHESNECLMNSLERNSSKIECLSNRLKSMSKSKSLEECKKKLKLQEMKNFRKHKIKDTGSFSGFENRADKMDVNDSLEMLAGTSDSSGFRNSQSLNLLKDDLSDKSEDAKHFVIKNSLHCDSNSFDDNPFPVSDDNHPNSNLLDFENSLSPKGYLNPLFNSLEDAENLNAVPVYTTKDGKITYSPNPRFTYRTLLMEALEKEQAQSSNYSSTSQDRRSKSSEKRAFSKLQDDLKPPKKSLAKRFATQELEKSYQRYLSHRERKASISNEPMLIKTIKNYSAISETTSGNEGIDDKLSRNSNADFDDIHLQIEREISRNCLKEQINQEKSNISDGMTSVAESGEENHLERVNDQVFTEIQSPSQGDAEDNQVVPVALHDKDSSTESNNVIKNKSNHSIVRSSVQEHLDPVENSLEITEVDQIQHCNVDFPALDSTSRSEVEMESNANQIPDSLTKLKLKFTKYPSIRLFSNPLTRRKSTSDVKLSQSSEPVAERRRSVHNFPYSTTVPTVSDFSEKLANIQDEKNSENKISDPGENAENSRIDETETIEAQNIPVSILDSKSCENKISDPVENTETTKNDEIQTVEAENVESDNFRVDTAKVDNLETNNIEADNVPSDNVQIDNVQTDIVQTDIVQTGNVGADNFEIDNDKIENVEKDNPETINVQVNNIETENLAIENKQSEKDETTVPDIVNKNLEIEKPEINKIIEVDLETGKRNALENTSGENQKQTMKDIPIINIDIEEKEAECLITENSPTKKEDDIEIIEIDDDDVFIVEPKIETSPCLAPLEKVEDNQEIEIEKKVEPNPEEIQSLGNQVEKLETESDLKLESNIVDDEIQEIDFLPVPVKEAVSNTEPENKNKNDNNRSSNQVNENQTVFQRFEESANLRSENKLSDFEREVEILSEIIESHGNFTGNEIHNFTNDVCLDEEFDNSKHEFQEIIPEPRQENQDNNGRNPENDQERDENNRDRIEKNNQDYSRQRQGENQENHYHQLIKENQGNQENNLQLQENNPQIENNQRYEEDNRQNAENNEQNEENAEIQKLNENRENNQIREVNLDNQTSNQILESELKNYEREYFKTRGLSPLSESNSSTQVTSNDSDITKEISQKDLNEKCSINENKNSNDESQFQPDDLPIITEKDHENDSDSVYIDDESCFEIDPPVLEVQRELNESDILNSPKSSDSNEFSKMPDVTLEENDKRDSQCKNAVVEKMVPKLVIRKIDVNRNTPVKSKSTESNNEPSFHRKIPKMIIRNAKSRPTTPTIEEIPEELPLSQEESNVIKVKIRLDDINKNDSYIFSNEENRIPKMKIKLEDKLPKVVIKNLDIRNSQDLQKLVPKVKIKKLKNLHTITDNNHHNSTIDTAINDSPLNSTDDSNTNFELSEIAKNFPPLESSEPKLKIPKLKIMKDSKSNSSTRKRHNSDVTSTESKKVKKSSRDETKQDRRIDTTLETSLSSSDCHNMSEKIPKVIIKRASPTDEFKCEVSNDKRNTSVHDLSLQPQVVLQRSWILDCMAKELKHVNIALKLAIAKNGSKASVRGKSNTSKIRWEQFIRSLKKQKELSRSESNSNVIAGKVKPRRKSDMGIRYFQSDSRLCNVKACKSARESTISDTSYLNSRALYFKNMFNETIIKDQQFNTFDTWKKFDENMNSESKDLLQNSEKFKFPNFPEQESQREIKLNDDVEMKCPLLNAEEVDSKPNLSLDIGSSPGNIDEIQVMEIKTEENPADRPEFSMANGEHEHLYSEDAIPTQFEFELEIVDSSVDTYDVPMSDSKDFLESIDSVDLDNSNNVLETGSTNDFDQIPRLLPPNEDSFCMNNDRDDSCDIKDEIPVLNDLINSSVNEYSKQPSGSSSTFSDSMSLVQEVMAAKEILKKYLPNCRNESTSSKSRPKTLAEKKQGSGFSMDSASTETSEHRSSRNHTRYDKKRSKESSSSREKHKSAKAPKIDQDSCVYDQHNTISLRDQKRSSLHLTQSRESSKTKDSDSRSKSSDSSSKRSRSKSDSRRQKSRESSKESRDSSKGPRESSKDPRESSRDARDGDVNRMKSYKIPKISKSRESGGDNATEVKAKKEMPILEPEGGVNVDPSLARDTSRSPPVITNQDDVEILEEESKIFNAHVKKEDKLSWKMKTSQVDLGGTLADAVQNWVFHEKATIKHRRYCVLCERWFPSVIRHRRHLSGYQHRHTELTQRRTIHTLFMLFTGKPCPRLLPADVLRSDCSLGEATPLQIAVQNVALGYGKAHEKSETKDDESKK